MSIPKQSEMVRVEISPVLLAVIDAWNKDQPEQTSRPEAIRRMVMEYACHYGLVDLNRTGPGGQLKTQPPIDA